MHYNQLGRTGLFVSELCLGTMTFGGSEGMWGKIGTLQQDEADASSGRRSTPGSTSSTPPTSTPKAGPSRSSASR